MSTTLSLPTAPPRSHAPASTAVVVLVGNPNAGKTSLFNALTGLRQKVANYPGVTVERKEGVWSLAAHTTSGANAADVVRLIDLPGLYSFDAASPDERIARDVILGEATGVPEPDVVVAVVDATNLRRNLYLVAQLIEFGKPVVVALTMVDSAARRGLTINHERLSAYLGCPVVPVIAARRHGLDRLAREVVRAAETFRLSHSDDGASQSRLTWRLSSLAERELGKLADDGAAGIFDSRSRFRILHELYGEELPDEPARRRRIADARARLAVVDDDWWQEPVLARYKWVEEAVRVAGGATDEMPKPGASGTSTSNATAAASSKNASPKKRTDYSALIDSWTTHRILGPVIFFLLMLVVFQTIFSWASLPMDLIDTVFSSLGDFARANLPEGLLTDLIVDGVIAGVGGVLVFLPQICLLFFFVALLEDSGYMARAAFLMDRLMRGVGLHGKAFVPLLSSFACAIPGIMATRTIEDRRDRLATIMIAPLMSCSARLPVYTLMIAAFFADSRIWFLSTGAIVMMSMYLLGVVAAIAVAWALKRTVLRAPAPPLVLEMPPYRMPQPGVVLQTVASRAMVFVRRAGTVILALSILLWALTTFPRTPEMADAGTHARAESSTTETASTTDERRDVAGAIGESTADDLPVPEASEQLRQSFAGRAGHLIEPVIAPLGFDWQIGIGLIASFAAREVFVSTMSIVYNVGDAEEDDSSSLIGTMRAARRADGSSVWTPLTALSLMVFFVLACQCISTVAVVRRETNSWRWTAFMVLYMLVLAYAASFVIYQGGRLIGFV